MQNREYEARIEAVKQRAHGRWTEILANLGVDERILKRRNLPCPLCGGTDRFQYTDKFGEGNYHCRSCGPGGGFKLLQAVLGIDFNTALCDVAFVLARRLKREAHHTGKRDVQVFVPKDAGVDWSDLWLRRVQALSAQAA